MHHRLALTVEEGLATVDEMAEHFEVHPNTIRNYIKGRSTPPPIVIREWATVTGVDYEWLRHGRIIDDDGSDPIRYPTETVGYPMAALPLEFAQAA